MSVKVKGAKRRLQWLVAPPLLPMVTVGCWWLRLLMFFRISRLFSDAKKILLYSQNDKNLEGFKELAQALKELQDSRSGRNQSGRNWSGRNIMVWSFGQWCSSFSPESVGTLLSGPKWIMGGGGALRAAGGSWWWWVLWPRPLLLGVSGSLSSKNVTLLCFNWQFSVFSLPAPTCPP